MSGALLVARRGIIKAAANFDPASPASATLKGNLDFSTLTGNDGDAISSLTDPISGQAFTQATAQWKPILRKGANGTNGLAVGEFGITGGAPLSVSLTSAAFAIASGSLSFLAVVDLVNNTSDNWLLDAQTGRFVIYPSAASAANKAGWYDGTFKGPAAGASGLQLMSWVLTSGGNGQVWRNGVSLGTVAYTAKAIGGTVVLGNGNGGGTPVVGKVCQLLAYQGALNGTDRAYLEAGLKSKWGTP